MQKSNLFGKTVRLFKESSGLKSITKHFSGVCDTWKNDIHNQIIIYYYVCYHTV